MKRRKNCKALWVAQETHKTVKVLAAQNELTVSEMIAVLIQAWRGKKS